LEEKDLKKGAMKADIEASIPPEIAIDLKPGEIIYSENGSFTIAADDTIRRAERILDKIGVTAVYRSDQQGTTRLPIVRLNRALGKARCHRIACLSAHPPTPLNRPPREVFGKGVSEGQCKASAMMEAVERYCGQKFAHSRTMNARYEEIKDWAIHPSEFKFPSLPVKCEYCPDRERGCFKDLDMVSKEWTWGYSLLRKVPILVPSAIVYYPYISEEGESFVFNDTGGLSAGNTMEEAILHGIAEIIERDALFYDFNLGNLGNAHLVNLIQSKSKYIQECIPYLDPLESIFVFHIANREIGLDIPSFSAFVCYKKGNARRYFGGSGTSLNPEIALLRALTEMEQQKVRQGVIGRLESGALVARSDLERKDAISLDDMPNKSTGNVKGDIELYLNEFSNAGTDVIVVDLTHPDIKIPVVRVLVPKLISYSGSAIKEEVFLKGMNRCFLQ
jgi:YcaO-like protein with predicted kinase domain